MTPLSQRTSNLVFSLSFGALLGLYVTLAWCNRVPPMQDLGAHIEMMDIAAHHDDSATGYEHYFIRPDRPLPNTLSLGAAWALGGWVDTATTAKLLLTLYLLGFPLALLWLCRVMGRPRWWVFFAAPLTINPLLPLGLLNYLLALPLIIVCIAAAVRWSRDAHRPSAVILGIALTLLAFAHMVGYLFGALLSGLVLLLYTSHWRQLARFLLYIPSLVPGLGFFTLLTALPAPSGRPSKLTWTGTDRVLNRIWADSVDTFTGPFDDIFGVVLGVLAVLLLIQRQAVASASESSHRPGPLAVARSNPLVVVAAAVAVGYLLAPHRYGEVWIQFRLPVLFVALLLLVPRAYPSVLTRVAVAFAVVGALSTGAIAVKKFRDAGQKFEPLLDRLEQLPTRTRLASPLPGNDPGSHFHFQVQRAVRGLHGWLNGGASSHAFMSNYYTPVRFKDGFAPSNPPTPLDDHIYDYDYAVVRSFTPPDSLLAASHLNLEWVGSHWWLFSVQDIQPPTMTVTTGGRLGAPARLPCPDDSAMVGLRMTYDALGLESLSAKCAQLSPLKVIVGKPKATGLTGLAGPDGEAVDVDCPTGQVVVGLTGKEGASIRSVGLLCQLARDAFDIKADSRTRATVRPPPEPGATRSGPLPTFVLPCPGGTAAVGFRGRAGLRLEAVGLACDVVAPDATP